MRSIRRGLVTASLAVALVAPAATQADPFVTNPFGNLTMRVTKEPSGSTPGEAVLTIVTANGQAFTGGRDRVYFGFRIMGGEDLRMLSFRLPDNPKSDPCIVSDFAGRGTDGWQLGEAFGTSAPVLDTPNARMRMIGGYLEKRCGNIEITVAFNLRPLVAFYGAFFGYTPAPWHHNYGDAPWNTVPTGGDRSAEEWWNLWGTFDTLGYSNACTSIAAGSVSCG